MNNTEAVVDMDQILQVLRFHSSWNTFFQMNLCHNGSSRPGNMKHGTTAKNCTGSHNIRKKRKMRGMIKMRGGLCSTTHCGPKPWGMTVFLILLFLSCRPTLSYGGKNWRDYKEVTVDKRFRERVGLRSLRRTNLIVQITPRQKQRRTKRQYMGASTTSTILSLSHRPLHCNDAASKMIYLHLIQ